MGAALKLETIKDRLGEVLKTTPFRYQLKGIRFMEKHKGRVLLCDDMGLGKTAQSIGWAALHPEARPVIIICPASVKYGWQREIKKHAGLKSTICEGEMSTPEQDKVWLRKQIEKAKEHYPGRLRFRAIRAAKKAYRLRCARMRKARITAKKAKILIINFDIVESWLEFLQSIHAKIIIIDECHYVKNRKAKRTKAVYALTKGVPHVIGMSGTPISGKPIEFFPILQMIRPREFSSYWTYGMEFCAPVRNRWSGAWDFPGATNLDQLHARLKSIMIRRMKSNPKIARELGKAFPGKQRIVMPIDIDNRDDYEVAEENFLSWLKKNKGDAAFKRAKRAEAIVKLNSLKLLSAKGKMKHAIKWITEWLESTDQKLIVFGVHKKILRRLRKKFPTSAFVDGSVSAKAKGVKGISPRQMEVDRFRKDKKCRLFIGHMKAAGQGVDGLQVASSVLFLEVGWTPGEHDQAEDRALRIGQDQHVTCYYLVGRRTVEERMLSIIEEKSDTVGRILDGKKGGAMKLLQMFMREAG